VKIYNAEFILGSTKPEHFPKTTMPEIAFSGRSNVGKSSLINSIVHRKNLAKISGTPGKTKQINFFFVENMWVFADLPGFGYASVSKSERELWLKLNMDYLNNRENLKLICSLVDGRHEPMEKDLAYFEWLENNNKKFIIVMTKCDKLSKKMIETRKSEFEFFVQNCTNCVEVLPYSSITDLGRNSLFAIIDKFIKKS
jgi:GTP-binding protein